MKPLSMALLLCFLLSSLPLKAQIKTGVFIHGPASLANSIPERSGTSDPASIHSLKKPGHYSAKDWRALVDSTWGPGLPTSTKLQIFDFFWDLINNSYAGFPYLNVNWDSMKALYRPEVAAGVSRGRFQAILGQMYLPLCEIHTYIADAGLDSSFLQGNNFVFRPGIPMFWTNGWGPVGNFGAALTPLPDSSLLIYRAIASHPLGLVPGDIVLGYDRIPWKRLYQDLIAAQLPFEWWYGPFGSTARTQAYSLLSGAGNNWGLFDSIDVVKYATGDTLHLPTAPLTGLDWFSLFATDQVPVPGVPMPNYLDDQHVTWGVVQNTSIGYVYVYRWENEPSLAVQAALNNLIYEKQVTGLIIDFRFNTGSYYTLPSDNWFTCLFNQEPVGLSRWRNAWRDSPSNHLSFAYSPGLAANVNFPAHYYDRPIAVLTGPAAWSFGDINAFRMRFHPGVRFFGLPTNGSFPAVPGSCPYVEGLWGSWYYQYVRGQMESLVNNEGYLMHKGFPVDEEVWLTRDGVAKGEDDVVKRAIQWMGELTYAHDVDMSHHYARPGVDSVSITAVLANPLLHVAAVSAIVTDALGSVRDSLLLFDDGLHDDGSAGDSVWGCRIRAPSDEGVFAVSIRTEDIAAGSFRRLPSATYFVTAGPLAVDRIDSAQQNAYSYFGLKPYIRNLSTTTSLTGVSVALSCDSPWVKSIVPPVQQLAPLLPNTTASLGVFKINYDSSAHPNKFTARLDMLVNGVVCWSEWKTFDFSDVKMVSPLPTEFALDQNYPNPFNPKTVISCQWPVVSYVRLVVYDILGREVAVLLNEKRVPGRYEVEFDASGLSSGTYFYRLEAGSFVQTRKMTILK